MTFKYLIAGMKILLMLVVISLAACAKNAKNIPINNIAEHIKYQDNNILNGKYTPDVVAEYNKLISTYPKSPEIYYLNGRINQNTSSNFYLKSLQFDSKFYLSLVGLALNNIEIDPQLSLSYAQRAIESNPQGFMGYFCAGRANTALAQDDVKLNDQERHLSEAIKMFKTATQLPNEGFFENYPNLISDLEKLQTDLRREIKQVNESKHIGSWYFSDGFNIEDHLVINRDGTWSDFSTISGSNSGTWEGNANYFSIKQYNMIIGSGNILNEGKALKVDWGGFRITYINE